MNNYEIGYDNEDKDNNLTDKAYEAIKELILSAKLRPGDPLATSRLCQQLSMSRTPVRDAIKRLETEGLVTSISGRGHFVQKLTSKDIKEIYYLRETLEVAALKLSINNITDRQIEDLEKCFKKVGDNLQQYIEENKFYLFNLDKKLHKLIIHESMNEKLIKFVEIINSQIELVRSISAVMPGRLEESYKEHRKILSAIKERDLKQAEICLKFHLNNIKETSVHINDHLKKYVEEVRLNG